MTLLFVTPPHPPPTTYSITVQVSKTDPFRHGSTIRLAPSGHPLLCPARTLSTFLQRRPPTTSTQSLLVLTSGSPLTRHTLTLAIRQLAALAGLNSSMYSSHSFRTGAATTASAVGLPESLIKTLGRWSSNAVHTYILPPPTVLDSIPNALVCQHP